MPKHERGTPKDIAIRMKAKGLQKLKFYCQMCNKQCRDENGFKCHLTSDSHLRQMQIFSSNSGKLLDQFSAKFEKMYLDSLKRRHGFQRMNANNVYQEVIQDRDHVHMNATKWITLSEFVQYLGKTGKCVVEETERGWYVTYINRDPLLLKRQEAQERKARNEKLMEKKMKQRMELQMREAAKVFDEQQYNPHVQSAVSNIDKSSSSATPIITLVEKKKKKNNTQLKSKKSIFDDNDDSEEADTEKLESDNRAKSEEKEKGGVEISSTSSTHHGKNFGEKRKQESLHEMNTTNDSEKSRKKPKSSSQGVRSDDEEENYKKKEDTASRKNKSSSGYDTWLHKGIYVQVKSKQIGKGKYYNRKGIVDRVISGSKRDPIEAEIEIIDSSKSKQDGGDILRVDERDLQTVVPNKVGKKVLILKPGKYFGCVAYVEKLNDKKERADLKLSSSFYNEKSGSNKYDEDFILPKVHYDDFSKAE